MFKSQIVFFDIDDTLFRKWKNFLPESVLPAFQALMFMFSSFWWSGAGSPAWPPLATTAGFLFLLGQRAFFTFTLHLNFI